MTNPPNLDPNALLDPARGSTPDAFNPLDALTLDPDQNPADWFLQYPGLEPRQMVEEEPDPLAFTRGPLGHECFADGILEALRGHLIHSFKELQAAVELLPLGVRNRPL